MVEPVLSCVDMLLTACELRHPDLSDAHSPLIEKFYSKQCKQS